MEGISSNVYKGIKIYWKRKGYKRLNKPTNINNDPVLELGSDLDPNPVRPKRKRRFFRVKLNRRIRIWKKFVGLPKKILTRLRDAYVNMMLHIANSGLVVGGAATGFGGPVDYGYGLSNYRTQLKEYDEKVIVEIYKSLMIAQGQFGNAAKITSTTSSSSHQPLRNSPKTSISTR